MVYENYEELNMKNIITVARVEWLKLKGVGLVWTGVVLALLIPLLRFTVKIFQEKFGFKAELSHSVFETAITDSLGPFAKFFLILFIILAASRITQTDHKNGGWLLMETQPITRFQIYFAKFLNVAFLSFLTIGLVFLFSYVLDVIYNLVWPNQYANYQYDVLWHLSSFIKVFVLSLGIISFQLFLSVVFSGFILPVGIGVIGLIANMASAIFSIKLPYSPIHTIQIGMPYDSIREANQLFGRGEALSIFWTVVFLMVGYFWYSKGGFKNAFLKTKKTIATSVGMLVLFTAGYFWVEKPKMLSSNQKTTVISGQFRMGLVPDEVKIFSSEFDEEVATIPVKDGKFKWETDKNFPLGNYYLAFGSGRQPFVMSSGDWYTFDLVSSQTEQAVAIKTNRKAEINAMKSYYGPSRDLYNLMKSGLLKESSGIFYAQLRKEWSKNLDKMVSEGDAENYIVRDDYRKYITQEMALNFLKTIKEARAKLPEDDSKYDAPKDFVQELQDQLKDPSPLFTKSSKFLEYKLASLLPEGKEISNPDSLISTKIYALPKGEDRDLLLAKYVGDKINQSTSDAERNHYLNSNVEYFADSRYKLVLANKVAELNRSQKGMPFPSLSLLDSKGKTVNTNTKRGDYLVINLWSTKDQKGAELKKTFGEFANNYRYYGNLDFLSINVDKNKETWKKYLKENSEEKIQEYWLEGGETFMASFGISTLPHFIIVDQTGRVYNINSPKPDEREFRNVINELITSY